MIEAVSVRRFRSLRELHVTGLERLNVVTGSNNSGKTSLLEALFLICGHGNPATTSQLIASRGFAVAAGPTAQDPGLPASEIRDTYWKPLFSDLDMSEPIEVAADVIGLGRQVLTVQLERASTVEVALDRQSGFSSAEASGEGTLLLAFRNGNGGSAERRIRFVRGGIEMDVPNREPPFRAVLLGARSAVGPDEVRQLGRVRKRKQVDVLVEALQVVEPRLVGLEVISGSGPPMIWADVGLEELLPLEVMGGGLIRLAGLITSVTTSPGGVVLVDEIENGFHHSALPGVWGALAAAAERSDVQIVATTHSYECVQTAFNALGSDGFRLHRLEADAATGENRCVTYQVDVAEAAFRHALEVR